MTRTVKNILSVIRNEIGFVEYVMFFLTANALLIIFEEDWLSDRTSFTITL